MKVCLSGILVLFILFIYNTKILLRLSWFSPVIIIDSTMLMVSSNNDVHQEVFFFFLLLQCILGSSAFAGCLLCSFGSLKRV